jgi:succinoglycan biosynthesis transport protein ExoP
MNEQSDARRRGLLSLYGMWGERDRAETTLRDVLNLVWRRRLAIALTVLIVGLATAAVLVQLPRIYSATTLILVEPRTNRVADTTAVLSGLPADFETIQTEIEILQSQRLQDKVVRSLELTKDPEFNATLREPSFLARQMRALTGADEPRTPEQIERITAANLGAAISVSGTGRSRVIAVTVDAESPQKAARIANALAEAYLVSQLDAKFEATQRTVNWLNRRLEELKEQVRLSEQAVEDYRQEAGLIEGRNAVSATAEQLSSLSAQIVLAGTQRAEAEARLANVRSLVASDGTGSVAEVLSNELIQRLRQEESELRRNMAALSQRYGPKHPQILQAQVELADLEQKMRAEIAKIVASLEGEVTIARTRENALIGAQRRLEGNLSSINQREIRLRELSREGDANRVLLETFLTRFKELAEQQDLQTTDSRVISEAKPPLRPSAPRSSLIMLAALAGALGLGLALAVAIERLDNAVHSTRDVENWTGLSVLAVVPEVKTRAGTSASKAAQVVGAPLSRYSESYRNLLVSLNLSNVDNPPRVIVVTSANPSEGKTVTSLSLAATAAAAGKRVLIVDGDLRRPRLHAELGVERGPGLVEFLSGQADLEAAMRTDERFRFQFITAGGETRNVLNLIESQKLRALLNQLKPHFGLIVIDTPPLLAVADARVLADRADSVLFAARWGKTSRNAILDGLKQLDGNSAPVAGVVMTRTDMDRLSSYQYGSTYYGKAYQSYYSS